MVAAILETVAPPNDYNTVSVGHYRPDITPSKCDKYLLFLYSFEKHNSYMCILFYSLRLDTYKAFDTLGAKYSNS